MTGERGGLEVAGLGVALPDGTGGEQVILDGVDLTVHEGEVVVLLGPSGAGKSTLVSALLGLLPPGALVRGSARWHGALPPGAGADAGAGSGPATGTVDLLDPGRSTREKLRGRLAAWLPQAPVSSLTPVLTVRRHLVEKARVHVPRTQVDSTVATAMERHDVDPEWGARLPSQLSGGQAQRVSNALSLMGDPRLVLADEPTTGLDRPRAEAVGAALARLAREDGRAVLVVTHDLTLAEQVADRVVEIDAGRSAPAGPPEEVVRRVREARHHDAGRRAPRGDGNGHTLAGVDLTLRRGRGTLVREGVTLTVPADQVTGLMAPSGAGKTTLLRTLALLHPPAAGQVLLDGRPLRGTGHEVPARVRRRIAYLPQDPRQSVDPRWTLGRAVMEPLALAGRPHDRTVVAGLLEQVGLDPVLAGRRADEVSGGQLQRAVLARALALDADYLLLDEPTSMVDGATAQALVSAVHTHQHRSGCGVLVASHDEELLRTWCDTVVAW
ncbi:ABC transporter, ATP-binding protein [Serinicoccus hydrothermalis]|uniref:ABC transporter, ATP-binding protein n=1 Tax=Serinicoccus hydrothermalis TaxID=1758689 RepID=A0A1B1NGR8_9MICO|nr:ATP-binding cassette domain-containing protein [Serinicoccus hydrothermalis]ANS80613.1 ABC transporter, ATP-binding protein [Serinicoccus hydrothermalis]